MDIYAGMTREEAMEFVEGLIEKSEEKLTNDKVKNVEKVVTNLSKLSTKEIYGKINKAIKVKNLFFNVKGDLEKLLQNIVMADSVEDSLDFKVAAIENVLNLASTVSKFTPYVGTFLGKIISTSADCLANGYQITSDYVDKLMYVTLQAEHPEWFLEEDTGNDDTKDPIDKDWVGAGLNAESSAKNVKNVAKTIESVKKNAEFLSAAAAAAKAAGVTPSGAFSLAVSNAQKKSEEYNEAAKDFLQRMNQLTGIDHDSLEFAAKHLAFLADLYFTIAGGRVVDPLILDLNGDGFDVQTKEEGAYFDLDCNGFAEKINWTTTDAILAVDLDANGTIDNGGEVFGDKHLLLNGNGETAKNGFEALEQYDQNKDGIIDVKDSIYKKLLLWTDSNGDGISQVEELQTMSDLGIESIDLKYSETVEETGTEAVIGNTATFSKVDGSEGRIGEMWVSSNLYDTKENGVSEIEGLEEIPNVCGLGNISSLHVAISRDATGVLKDLVNQFTLLEGVEERREIVVKILKHLCINEETNMKDSRYLEPEKLAILEAVMGKGFVGVNDSSVPNIEAAKDLERAYENVVNIYYYTFLGYEFQHYFNLIEVKETENGTEKIDAEMFNAVLYMARSSGEMNDSEFRDFLDFMGYYCKNALQNFKVFVHFKEYFKALDFEYVELIEQKSSFVIKGTELKEIKRGTSEADVIYGYAGDDELYGEAGNDVLDGGTGNDKLYGGAGDDIYIFEKGSGTKYITDYLGTNVIRFGEGITPEDFIVNRGSYDVTITFKDSEDKLVLTYFSKDVNYRNYTFEFADGRVIGANSPESPLNILSGTVLDDSMTPLFEQDSILYGMEGEDVLFGKSGNDKLYGGVGDDTIHGEAGNDVLDGGTGTDYLVGGAGDDTYIFEKGCGTKTVYDCEGENRIRFGEGIVPEDFIVNRGSYDVTITFTGMEDKLILRHFSRDINYRNFIFEFADGTVMAADAPESPMNVLYGTALDNSINPLFDQDSILYGMEGKDVLYGKSGDDKLYGGAGDDTIHGEAGNDVLDGGTGTDYLYGKAGDDIYIFEKGCGTKIVYDCEGKNRIRFGEGITPEDFIVNRGSYDVTITFTGMEDKLILRHFSRDINYRNITFEFADGTVMEASAPESPLNSLMGTSSDDVLTPLFDQDSVLYGLEGGDTLNGRSGNDKLYGGAGNDTLYGEAGDDTYFYNKEDGNDIIRDTSSDINGDTLHFGEGILAQDINIQRSSNDLLLNIDESNSVRIQHYFANNAYKIENFEFADGSSLTSTDIDSYGVTTGESTPLYQILVQTMASYDDSDGMIATDTGSVSQDTVSSANDVMLATSAIGA